jgi:hypothetical protein
LVLPSPFAWKLDKIQQGGVMLKRVVNSQFSFIGPILVGVLGVRVAKSLLDATVFSSSIPSPD